MPRFAEMTRPEAEAFLAGYVAAAPSRVASFAREVEDSGGPPAKHLDGSPDSLVPLWTWVVSRVDADPGTHPGDHVPSWYASDDQFAGEGMSEDLVWLADGLAYYVADALRRAVPGARWEVGHSKVKSYVDQNRPVLAGFRVELNPLRLVLTALRGARDIERKRRPEALRELFDVWVSEALP